MQRRVAVLNDLALVFSPVLTFGKPGSRWEKWLKWPSQKLTYCWWFRNPAITSWYGKYPIIYRVFYIVVVWDFWTINCSTWKWMVGKWMVMQNGFTRNYGMLKRGQVSFRAGKIPRIPFLLGPEDNGKMTENEGKRPLWYVPILPPLYRCTITINSIHPPKQTWNLKMDPWKRRFLLETIISRFHVNFWGCNYHPYENMSLSFEMVGHWKITMAL